MILSKAAIVRGKVTPVIGGGGYSAEVLADSPLLYWRLGDAGPTTAADSSGDGLDGTASGDFFGATGLLTGDADTAISIPTGDNVRRIDRTGVASLPVNTADQWTIEFWHHTTSYVSLAQIFGFGRAYGTGGSPGLEGAGGGTKNNRYVLQFNDNYYFWGDGADWDTGIAWDVGSTRHIVFSFDGSKLRMYRDGSPAASRSGLPAGMIAALDNVTLGSCHSAGSCPDATIDEVAIYAAALSSARIAAHYAAGA